MNAAEMLSALTDARREGCLAPLVDPDCGPCRDGFRHDQPRTGGREYMPYRGHYLCPWHGRYGDWWRNWRNTVDRWIEVAA